MIEYYLRQFSAYSQKYGVRLLDYLDIHGYFAPQYNGTSVALTTAGNTAEQVLRLNGTRVFWDPTYTDSNFPQPNYTTDSNYTTSCSPPAQAPQLIPMLQGWVAKDYPGTKVAIDEYNFGGLESINGAVAQADILGIFGRQGLNMAAFLADNHLQHAGARQHGLRPLSQLRRQSLHLRRHCPHIHQYYLNQCRRGRATCRLRCPA